MKYFLILIFAVTSLTATSQKLSQETINDVALNLNLQWKYGRGYLKQFAYQHFTRKGLSLTDMVIAIETFATNAKNRELVLEFFSTFGGYDGIFRNVHSLGVSAVNAKAVTDYVLLKYRQDLIVRSEPEKKKAKFSFTGVHSFLDENEFWKVVITFQDKIAILKFYYGPEHPKYDKYKQVASTTKYKIINGSLYSMDGEYEMAKFEDGLFLEMSNEGTWNEYYPIE